MSKVNDIIKQLQELTLMEAAELVKAIEETFGVSAAAPVAVATSVANTSASATDEDKPEEKSSFNIKVTEVPSDKKIAVIKVVKTVLNIGLGDAKAKVESAPFILLENVSKEEAEKYKQQLVEAGATVQLE
jgi:large subunit ribosomal protein L7/L12